MVRVGVAGCYEEQKDKRISTPNDTLECVTSEQLKEAAVFVKNYEDHGTLGKVQPHAQGGKQSGKFCVLELPLRLNMQVREKGLNPQK